MKDFRPAAHTLPVRTILKNGAVMACSIPGPTLQESLICFATGQIFLCGTFSLACFDYFV